jgi:signal transduction histidine kinase
VLIELLIYIPAIISIIIIGLFVYLSNPNNSINRYFALFNLVASLWLISQFVYDISNSYNMILLFFRISLFFGQLIPLFLLFFSLVFPFKAVVNKTLITVFSVIYVVFSFFAFSDLNVSSVEVLEYGVRALEQGPLYNVSDLLTVLIVLLSLFVLISKLKHTNNSNYKKQIKLLFMAIGITVVANVISGVVLLEIYRIDSLSLLLGTLSVLAFSIIVAYAIIQQKLFNVRNIVARTVGYVLVVSIVSLMYVSLAYVIKIIFFPDLQSSNPRTISNVILTILIVLTFPKINRTLDKVSNKIFFRDAYDPQQFIDRINQTLVSNVDLDELLTKIALTMQEEMKASFTTFYIRETSYFDNRIIGAHRKTPEFESIDDIEKHAAKIHSKVFSSELVSDVENDKKLSQALKKNDVEIIARLTNTLDFEVKGIGYIFMGPKRSGSPYSNNDLKILEIISNELVIAIENVLRFEEIEQFNVTLQKKIDEATKELKLSNEKLKALDEAKDEFVSMASHQLRTPLTSIKGYISMVLEGDAGKITETQKTMLGQAFFSSQRMVYLISDLLNVSRLKTGKFIIETKPTYLPDVVETEIQQLVEGANAKNLTLAFTKPKEFSTLLLDEMKLRQVIMNFTDNAIYYTPAGGKITIELKETPKFVEFTVKDSGIGVPKDQQHKLFTKFYRADNARKARPDGTGLGLFMAKKVIIAQGGSMIFDSTLDKGSTFGFSFPKEKILVESSNKPESPKKA